MTANKAYQLFWKNYFNAHTKTSRVGFWKAFLDNIIVNLVVSFLSFGILGIVYDSVTFIPNKAMLARRLQDIGMSQCTAEFLVAFDIIFDFCYLVMMLPLMMATAIFHCHVLALITGLLLIYKLLLLVFCMMSSQK